MAPDGHCLHGRANLSGAMAPADAALVILVPAANPAMSDTLRLTH